MMDSAFSVLLYDEYVRGAGVYALARRYRLLSSIVKKALVEEHLNIYGVRLNPRLKSNYRFTVMEQNNNVCIRHEVK